jgi:hypothetical protein
MQTQTDKEKHLKKFMTCYQVQVYFLSVCLEVGFSLGIEIIFILSFQNLVIFNFVGISHA